MAKAELIAAIGDVHGEAALLQTMLRGISTLSRELRTHIDIYFLGDIVDRGTESCRAMDLVCRTLADHPQSRLFLGNHDDWFLRFLADQFDALETANWIDQGGAETLLSYGVGENDTLGQARRRILETHVDHFAALQNASIIETKGRFVFVHAGIDPHRPVDRQVRDDCLWIRDPFLDHVGYLSHIVIHGHQPQERGRPVVTENRISMDTGAVLGGGLSCILLNPETAAETRFFQSGLAGHFYEIEPIRQDRGLGAAIVLQ